MKWHTNQYILYDQYREEISPRYDRIARDLRGTSDKLASKHKEHGANQTEAGPKIIQFEGFLQIENGKRHKHAQGDDFLNDLQLTDTQRAVADAIGGHLKEELKKRNTPTDKSGDQPGLVVQLLEMGVPGKGHKDVAANQEQYGGNDRVQDFSL